MSAAIRCNFDELVELDKLNPHPRNRNKHPDDQIDMYIKILTHQGIRAPIRVSKRSNVMTKGHGLLMSLRKMGETKAPVEFQDYDDEEMEQQDLIADNELQKWAQTDFGQVNTDIQELGPFDIELLGIKDFVVEPTENFEPGTLDDQGKLDELEPKWVKCPACEHKFNSRLYET